jgi:hypothetical protein
VIIRSVRACVNHINSPRAIYKFKSPNVVTRNFPPGHEYKCVGLHDWSISNHCIYLINDTFGSVRGVDMQAVVKSLFAGAHGFAGEYYINSELKYDRAFGKSTRIDANPPLISRTHYIAVFSNYNCIKSISIAYECKYKLLVDTFIKNEYSVFTKISFEKVI